MIAFYNVAALHVIFVSVCTTSGYLESTCCNGSPLYVIYKFFEPIAFESIGNRVGLPAEVKCGSLLVLVMKFCIELQTMFLEVPLMLPTIL